jgi:hypothetical protein
MTTIAHRRRKRLDALAAPQIADLVKACWLAFREAQAPLSVEQIIRYERVDFRVKDEATHKNAEELALYREYKALIVNYRIELGTFTV